MPFMIRYPSETVASLFSEHWTGESRNTTQEEEELEGVLENTFKSSIQIKTWK